MAAAKANNGYSKITALEHLDGVRLRLSMYLGSTSVIVPGHSPRGLVQAIQEVVSNSADEHIAGYGDKINVTIRPDNSVTVQDFGRGMPKGPYDSFEDVENACTKSHASGKFDDDAYAALGVAGLHGIGLKAVNAGSSKMIVECVSSRTRINKNDEKVVARGFEHYIIEFKQAEVIRKEVVERFDELPEGMSTGTKITFWPDDGPISEEHPEPVFESIDWKVIDLIPRFESLAFLMNGLEIIFEDQREPEESDVRIRRWKYENGLTDYVMQLVDGQDLISKMQTPLLIHRNVDVGPHEFELNLAMIFTEDIGTSISSYANSVPTKDGGPHYDGFVSGLVSNVNKYAKDKRLVKKPLTESDVLDGLTAVFELRVPSKIIDFEGQTKEKLGTAEARRAVQKIMDSTFLDWLYDNEPAANELIKKMQISAESRAAAVQARREAQKARQVKNNGSIDFVTSSKLKSASSRKPEEKELYITEGDSASNIGRDQRTQAVFPIRGKIKNAYKSTLTEAMKNVEIYTIMKVIGAGIAQEFSPDDMQYHKIIIAADGDSDGGHIRMLLIGIFAKFFPGLIDTGRLYAVEAPLYKAVKYIKGKPQTRLFYTQAEMDAAKAELSGYEISRFKGLGEMNLDDAHTALADPKTRRLIRITRGDAIQAKKTLKIMLGDDADLRKQWIAENIDFDAAEV